MRNGWNAVVAIAVMAGAMFTGPVQAQHDWCGTDHQLEQLFLQDPAQRQAFLDHKTAIAEIAHNRSAQSRKMDDLIIVPVVVHVMYNDCENNISNAQVVDAMRVLNEDFRRRNADANETRDIFKDLAEDVNMEFRLARIDPDGNPTTGINHVETPLSVNANNSVKSISRWPSDQYLNIWLVESIDAGAGSGNGIILGYAQFPNFGSWSTYGVVMRNDRFGTIGTANGNDRTYTHEVGHCLGLLHTFQSGCGTSCGSSGDFICDTPPVEDPTWSCSNTQNTCSNDQVGTDSPFTSNVFDMIENYMSYDDCQNMFTSIQAASMRATIENTPRLTTLVSEANLIATGVKDLSFANFQAGQRVICVGDFLSFADQSTYGATSWNWDLPNSMERTSQDQNPRVQYNWPGLFDVNLEVSNGTTTRTVNRPGHILVTSRIGNYLPLSDDFEAEPVPNERWIMVNHDGDGYAWEATTDAAASGTRSVKMDNFGSCGGSRSDDLVGASLDLSQFSSVELKFNVAYARRNADDNDILRLFVSTDCGASWIPRWASSKDQLATVPALDAVAFTPTSPTHWREESISIISPIFLTEGLLFKFEFLGGGGNNLYLDDFRAEGVYKPVPVLERPIDGAEKVDADALLNWKSVEGVQTYEYELDVLNTFDSPALISGSKSYIDASPKNEDTEFQAAGLDNGVTYFWRVRARDANGNLTAWSDTWSFTISENGVSVEETLQARLGWQLFPNPAEGMATVAFTLQEPGHVRMALSDLLGRELNVLATGHRSAGAHQITFNSDQYPAGIYFIRTEMDGESFTRKVVVR